MSTRRNSSAGKHWQRLRNQADTLVADAAIQDEIVLHPLTLLIKALSDFGSGGDVKKWHDYFWSWYPPVTFDFAAARHQPTDATGLQNAAAATKIYRNFVLKVVKSPISAEKLEDLLLWFPLHPAVRKDAKFTEVLNAPSARLTQESVDRLANFLEATDQFVWDQFDPSKYELDKDRWQTLLCVSAARHHALSWLAQGQPPEETLALQRARRGVEALLASVFRGSLQSAGRTYFPRNGLERSIAAISSLVLRDAAEAESDPMEALNLWSHSMALLLHTESTSFDDYGHPHDVLWDDLRQFPWPRIVEKFELIVGSERPVADRYWEEVRDLIQPFLDISGWFGDAELYPDVLREPQVGELHLESCPKIVESNSDSIAFEEIEVGTPWSVYWDRARVRVEERMRPDEVRARAEAKVREQAENRVRMYFFDLNDWDWIPDKAREYLLDADSGLFNDRSSGSIAHDLWQVTQIIFVEAIWTQIKRLHEEYQLGPDNLSHLKISTSLKSIGQILQRPEREQRAPSLMDCIHLIGGDIDVFLAHRASIDDIDWLRHDMRPLAERLNNDIRNPEDHDLGFMTTKEEIVSIYRQLFGIGQPGILQRLIAIARRLEQT